jgi:hypothetical protein
MSNGAGHAGTQAPCRVLTLDDAAGSFGDGNYGWFDLNPLVGFVRLPCWGRALLALLPEPPGGVSALRGTNADTLRFAPPDEAADAPLWLCQGARYG